MFKHVTTSLLALTLSLNAAQAKPSTKIFEGSYRGSADVKAERILYDPVIFAIDGKGNIKGTAYRTDSKKIFKVSGRISKVSNSSDLIYKGKASGSFSDGLTWSANLTAKQGNVRKTIKGLTQGERFTGALSLKTNFAR